MVEVCQKINVCIVGVGSNINPDDNIQAALAILRHEMTVTGVSKWIRTSPVGIIDQDDFINGAIEIHTLLSREAFKNYLKKLEDQLGRDRKLPKFGPRVIDLDIVAWNDEIVDEDYFTRDFVRNAVDELLMRRK